MIARTGFLLKCRCLLKLVVCKFLLKSNVVGTVISLRMKVTVTVIQEINMNLFSNIIFLLDQQEEVLSDFF